MFVRPRAPGRHQLEEALLAVRERFGAFAFGDVGEQHAPVQDATLSVAEQQTSNVHPLIGAVGAPEALFGLERLTMLERLAPSRDDSGQVVPMNDA
jgi:hypothetical protein